MKNTVKISLLSLILANSLYAEYNPAFESLFKVPIKQQGVEKKDTDLLDKIIMKEQASLEKEQKVYVSNNREFIKTLEKLITERKFAVATELLKSIDIDMSNTLKKEYFSFFEIVNSLSSNDIKVSSISNIDRQKTAEIFKIFAEYIDSGKIKDNNYIAKMINMVDRSNLSLDDKYRQKVRLYYLLGKATTALKISNSIEAKTKEDRMFEENLYKMLDIIQDSYFKNILKTNHKEWSILNSRGK